LFDNFAPVSKVMNFLSFKFNAGRSHALEQRVILNVDHIMRILENLQTLRERCNLGKSDAVSASA